MKNIRTLPLIITGLSLASCTSSENIETVESLIYPGSETEVITTNKSEIVEDEKKSQSSTSLGDKQLITKLENIDSLNAISESQLLSSQQLESLITSIKAGKQLQELNSLDKKFVSEENWQKTKFNTIATLQRSIYNTQELNRIEGHSQKVNAVTSARLGERESLIATASDDRTIKLWYNNGQLIKTITGHQDRVTDLVFLSHDTLATASADKSIILWKIENNNQEYTVNKIKTITGHHDWITQLAVSPDDRIFASASRDRTIKLWLQNGTLIDTLSGHNSGVTSISFLNLKSMDVRNSEDLPTLRTLQVLQDNKIKENVYILASGSEYGIVTICSILNNKPTIITTIKTDLEQINKVGFSKDGNQLLIAGDEFVQFWQISNNKLIRSYSHESQVNNFVFWGSSLVTSTNDGKIYFWDTETNSKQVITGHEGEITDLAIIFKDSWPWGKYSDQSPPKLISTGIDKTIRIWNFSNQENNIAPSGSIYTVSTQPQRADIFAVTTGNNHILLRYSKQSDNILTDDSLLAINWNTLSGHEETITQIKYSPDGKIIASASLDDSIKLWDLKTQELIDTLTGHEEGVNSISFSPDGNTLVSGSEDKTIKIWDISDRAKLVKTITGHTDSVKSVTVSADGKLIASTGYDNKILIWNKKGKLLQTIDAHNLAITILSFIPDSNALASASEDKTIKLWSILKRGKTHKLLHTLSGHQDSVTTIDLNSDGTLLASGSSDRNIKLWNVKTGKLIQTFRGHTSKINSLVFTSDDKSIISGEKQQGLFWWDLDLENLLLKGCDRISDYLANNPNVKAEDRKLCTS